MLILPFSEEGTATSPPGSSVEAPSEACFATNLGNYTPSSRERPCWLLHHHVLYCCSCSPLKHLCYPLWTLNKRHIHVRHSHRSHTLSNFQRTNHWFSLPNSFWYSAPSEAIHRLSQLPVQRVPPDAKAHRCILDSSSHTIQAQLHQGIPHTTHPPRLIQRAK